MIIGIDGKPLCLKTPNGLFHYAINIVPRVIVEGKKHTFLIFSPHPLSLPVSNNVINVYPPRILSWIPWQLMLPILSAIHHTDLFHFLQQHGSILLRHNAIITTVHDLADERAYPSFRENPYYFFLGKYVPFVRNRMLRKSNYFITISRTVKKELAAHGIPAHRIRIVYNGVHFTPKLHALSFSGRKYILAMTDFSPRKNIVRSIRAYAMLPVKMRKNYPLRIVMSSPERLRVINALTQQLGISKEVVCIAKPSNTILRGLYSTAAVFLYPSLYEGFGLPILEAFACGCPVITSDRGATAEIAADAGYLVNPLSESAITRAISRILQRTHMRKTLARKGFSRLRDFSWKTASSMTLLAYEKTTI